MHHALQSIHGQPFDVVADTVKKTAYQITRMGQLVAQEASKRLGVPFGIVDLSLAPTPATGDSVARVLEEMGLEVCGTHGTTAALALLNDCLLYTSTCTRLYPSLVQLKTDNTFVRALKGVRADARVTLLKQGTPVAKNSGEVQFTEYGVSGPAIFDISRAAAVSSGGILLSLDLLPEITEPELILSLIHI